MNLESFYMKNLLTMIRQIVQQVVLVTHIEFHKAIRNILLIEPNNFFDKALQLAVTVTVTA